MSGEDRFEPGKPLSKEGFFQLVTDEVYKDGQVARDENKVLKKLARFLKLDIDTARAIARLSKKKYDEGKLGRERPMKPRSLYRKVLYLIHAGGSMDGLEEQMLIGLRKLFHISDLEHFEFLGKVEQALEDRAAGKDPLHTYSEGANPLDTNTGAAPAFTQEMLEVFEEEAEAIAERAAKGKPAPDDEATATRLAKSALDAYRANASLRAAALGLVSRTVPALAAKGHGELVASALDTVWEVDRGWREADRLYGALLNALLGAPVGAVDPDRVTPGLDLAVTLAEANPKERFRWTGLVGVLRRAVMGLSDGRHWAAIAPLLTRFDTIPEKMRSAVLSPWVGGLRHWVRAAVAAEDVAQARKGLDALARLAAAEPARAEPARAHGGAIWQVMATGKLPPPQAVHLVEAVHGHLLRHGKDGGFCYQMVRCAVAAALARAAALKALGGEGLSAKGGFGSRLRGALGGRVEPEDSLLRSLQKVLSLCRANFPANERLREDFVAFEEGTDFPVPRAKDRKPVNQAPDLTSLQIAFWALQEDPSDGRARDAVFNVLGLGGRTRRVIEEGPGVLEADRPYFLALLEEVARQVREDRSGFWKGHAGLLHELTKTMIEEGGPAVAKGAAELRRRLEAIDDDR